MGSRGPGDAWRSAPKRQRCAPAAAHVAGEGRPSASRCRRGGAGWRRPAQAGDGGIPRYGLGPLVDCGAAWRDFPAAGAVAAIPGGGWRLGRSGRRVRLRRPGLGRGIASVTTAATSPAIGTSPAQAQAERPAPLARTRRVPDRAPRLQRLLGRQLPRVGVTTRPRRGPCPPCRSAPAPWPRRATRRASRLPPRPRRAQHPPALCVRLLACGVPVATAAIRSKLATRLPPSDVPPAKLPRRAAARPAGRARPHR